MGPPQTHHEPCSGCCTSMARQLLVTAVAAMLAIGCTDPAQTSFQSILQMRMESAVSAQCLEFAFTDQKSAREFKLSDAKQLLTELKQVGPWKDIGTVAGGAGRRSIVLELRDAEDAVVQTVLIREHRRANSIECHDVDGHCWVASWPRDIDSVLAEVREASAKATATPREESDRGQSD